MIEDRAGGPAISLMVSGVLGLVYNLFYLVWTFLPLFWGVIGVIAQIDKHGVGTEAIGAGFMFLSIPVLQFLAFMFTLALSALTLWAGMRFNRFESKGLVILGLAASTAVPVIGILSNSASSLNCMTFGTGLFGCLFGNIGMIPLLIVGLVATIWGIVAITGPLGDRFEGRA